MRFELSQELLHECDEARQRELEQSLDDANTSPVLSSISSVSEGEWRVTLGDLNPSGLTVSIRLASGDDVASKRLLWATLKTPFKEYREVIENIVGTGFTGSESRFEALDYGKKIVHDEAGEALQEILEEILEMDLPTARRLFTLIFLIRTELPALVVAYHRRHL